MEKAPKQGHPSQNNKYNDQRSGTNSFWNDDLLEDRLLSKNPLVGNALFSESIIAPPKPNPIITVNKETEDTEPTQQEENELQDEFAETGASKVIGNPTDNPIDVKEAARLIANLKIKKRGSKTKRKTKAMEAYAILKRLHGGAKDIKEFAEVYPNLWGLTIGNLPGEFLRSDGFGLFTGVSEKEKTKLLDLLDDSNTWDVKNTQLLELAMELVVQKFIYYDPESGTLQLLDSKVEEIITNHLSTASNEQKTIIENHHFTSGKYVPQSFSTGIEKTGLRKSGLLKDLKYSGLISRKKTLSIEGVSLAKITKVAGPMGGTEFADQTNENVDPKLLEDISKVNIQKDRENNKIKIDSKLIPIKGINYQGSTFTFRANESLIEGLKASIEFPAKGKEEAKGEINLKIDRLIFNNLRIISAESTMAIKKIVITNLNLKSNQTLGFDFKLVNSMDALYLILNYLSLTSSGLFMAMNNMAGPSNQEDIKSRANDQKELKASLESSFLHNMDMTLSFQNLDLEDFIYVDKDQVNDDITNETTQNKSAVSVIRKLSAHSKDPENPAGKITLNANGVPETDNSSLYQSKKELIAQEKESISLRNKIAKSTHKGREKRVKRLEKRFDANRTKITDNRKIISDKQTKLEYDLGLDIQGISTEGSGFTTDLADGLMKPYVASSSGLEKATADQLKFSTTFNDHNVKDTAIELKNFNVPDLLLNTIHFSDDKKLSIDATNANLINTTASLTVDFKNSGEEPTGVIGEQLYNLRKELNGLKNELQRIDISKKSLEAQQNTLPSATSELMELDIISKAKNQEYLEKMLELDNLKNPVSEIKIHNLNTDKIKLSKLIIKLLEARLEATLGMQDAIEISGLKMANMLINMKKMEKIDFGPTKGYDLSSLTVDMFKSSKDDQITKTNEIGQNILEVALHDIVAENLKANILRTGGIDYSLESLKGSTNVNDITYDKNKNASTQASIFTLPGLLPMQNEKGENLPVISGNYNNGMSTISARIPAIQIPQLDLGDKEFGIKAKGNQDSTLKGIMVDFEYNPGKEPKTKEEKAIAPSMTIKHLHVNQMDLWGLNLHLMKPADPAKLEEKSEYTVNFPKSTPISIQGLDLTNLRTENSINPDNENKVEWHYKPTDKNAVITTGATKLPNNTTLNDLVNKTSVTLQNGKWDKSSFTLLEHGGIKYSFANLDALLKLEGKDKKTNKEKLDAQLKVNSNTISGSFTSEKKIDEKGVLREYVTIGGNLDIPEILLKKLKLNSDKLSVKIPETSNESRLTNLKGKYSVIMKMPTLAEKREALKKANDAKEKAKTSEGKVKRDLLELAEKKAEPEINIDIDNLDIDLARLYEADIVAKSSSKIMVLNPDNNTGQYYVDNTQHLKMRKGESAMLRQLHMKKSHISLPHENGQKLNYKGSFTLGNETEKGLELGATEFTSTGIKKLLEGEKQFGSDNMSVTPTLNAQSITFGGDASKEFKLTVVKPEFDIPDHILPYVIGRKEAIMFGGAKGTIPVMGGDNKGFQMSNSDGSNSFSLDINKSKNAGGTPSFAKLFEAKSIELEAYKVTNSEGIDEYRRRLTITDPTLSSINVDGNNSIQFGNGKDFSTYIKDLKLHGKVTGKLVIQETEADLSKDKTGKQSPVWEIIADGSEITIESGMITTNVDNMAEYMKAKKQQNTANGSNSTTSSYNDNDYEFLDAASGTVTMSMFGINGSVPITQLSVPIGKGIEQVSYVRVRSLVEFIARRFNDELGNEEAAAVLDELTCQADRGEYWITTQEGGTVFLKRILNTTTNGNLVNIDGHENVRLSALVNSLVHPLDDRPAVAAGRIARFVEWTTGYGERSIMQSSQQVINDYLYRSENPMNPRFSINAKIDMSKLPQKDRGLLKILPTNEELSVKLNVGLDRNLDFNDNPDSPSYNPDTEIYPTLNISDLKMPPFTTLFGGSNETAQGSITSNGIEVKETSFQYNKHISTLAGQTQRLGDDKLKLSGIKIKGFNLKLLKK